ncbi:MAG: hypothetical protein EXR53_01410 [Dehalococcoidia bacterium]|nr:hypothetical protein [Dehalococcoidia bacterium]
MAQPIPSNPAQVHAIGERLVRVCLEVLGGDAIQGIIQGFSDFDAQVYLNPGQSGPYGVDTDKIFAMQERMDSLSVREAGFTELQLYLVEIGHLPPGWLGPIRGTYSVLYRAIPGGYEPTNEQLRGNSRKLIGTARQYLADFQRSLVDNRNDTLPRRLRLLSTITTPSVYALVSYDDEDASALWAEDKFTALQRLSERYNGDPGHQHALRFYDDLLAMGGTTPPPDILRAALRNGIDFLKWVDALNSNLLARQ